MKIGDVVRLKSGGPLMTISRSESHDGACWLCHWFNLIAQPGLGQWELVEKWIREELLEISQ